MSEVDARLWTPTWEDFVTLRAHARWTSDPGEEGWSVTVSSMDFDQGRRVVVMGYFDVVEGAYRVSVTVGLLSHYVDADLVARLDRGALHEVFLRSGNDILHDRAVAVAMSAGALVGVSIKHKGKAAVPVWRE